MKEILELSFQKPRNHYINYIHTVYIYIQRERERIINAYSYVYICTNIYIYKY